MSAKRAAMRREQKRMNKAIKGKSKDAELEQIKMRALIDGRTLAGSVVLTCLYESFGFRWERVKKLLKSVSDESTKCGNEIATQFNVSFYAERMIERILKNNIKTVTTDIREQIYQIQRDESYIQTCSVMFLSLNDKYGFGSNEKGTGRTDFVMEYCIHRYLEIQLDPDNHTPEYYFNKMVERTGFDIALD